MNKNLSAKIERKYGKTKFITDLTKHRPRLFDKEKFEKEFIIAANEVKKILESNGEFTHPFLNS